MFGWFRKRRLTKAIDAALEGGVLDRGPVEALEEGDRLDAWAMMGSRLAGAGDTAQARVAFGEMLSMSPDHWEALAYLAEIEREEGNQAESCRLYERMLGLDPNNAGVRAELVILLLEAGRAGEVEAHLGRLGGLDDLDLGLRLGAAFFGASMLEEASEVLGSVRETCERALRHSDLASPRGELLQIHQEASRLHDAAWAEVHGQEQVVVEAARRHQLNAMAGVNYTLLGQSLMVEAEPVTEHLSLLGVKATELLAADLYDAASPTRSWVLRGMALLRQGKLAKARGFFEKAHKEDGQSFAALLGMGAVMDAEQHDFFGHAKGIEDCPEAVGLRDLVPEYGVLTPLEAKIVRVSLHPLRRFVPDLVEAGVTLRLLPIDLRPTDLPELSHLAGDRSEDHRTIDAVGGAATPTIAFARIESLLDTQTQGAWTFAHEFAHLVFFYADDAVWAQVAELLEAGLEVGYVFDTYQMSNEDELFAGVYGDYLRWRHHCPMRREFDDEGLLQAFFELFETLD